MHFHLARMAADITQMEWQRCVGSQIRELWCCESVHLSNELKHFLRPGMGDGAAVAASGKSDTATLCGFLRVSRLTDWHDEFASQPCPLQRRWCTLRTTLEGAWLSYASARQCRPGAGAGGYPLRTIRLDRAVLSPAVVLAQRHSFELCSEHERVLFVERAHWLSVLYPLLSPKTSLSAASHAENDELQRRQQQLQKLNKRELRQRAELAGADVDVIAHAMDEEDPRPLLLQLIDFGQFWRIGGQRLGQGSHVGPHFLSRPSTIPDYTRRRSKSFSLFSTSIPAHWPSKIGSSRDAIFPEQTLKTLAADVKKLKQPLLRLALKSAKLRVTLFPEDAAGWCALAEGKSALGDWIGAKSDFIQSLSASPRRLSTTLSYERAYARACSHIKRLHSTHEDDNSRGRRYSECSLPRRQTGP
jgi:hypothetical protein